MQLTYPALLQQGIFINNNWQTGAATFPVYNPANGEVITNVYNAGVAETEQAIQAADAAFPAWSNKPAKERSDILKKWYQLIIQHSNDLALLLTTEQGKPLTEAKGEVQYGASFIEWFAEECRRTYGQVIPAPVADRRFFTIKQPIGVVAAITPWNFPIAMITRKIAPALAAGCTVVLKPAEDTPLCALALAQLAKEAGLPAGVLNVITTLQAAETGKLLTTHPAVHKISFTGSTEVGRILMQQSSSTLKKLSLELGGNAPAIVFNDADLQQAVKGTLASKYRNAGQTCVCANRVLVQKDIYPAFMKAYQEAVMAMQVGNGTTDGVTIGPLINQDAIDKIQKLLKDAFDKGAELLCGGKVHSAGPLFFEPTIITHCTPEMELSREEIFGPVSAVYVFETVEEAIALANNTEYGLAAYFFSKDVQQVWRIAEQLQYGIIGINEGIISFAEVPFGGIKQSGYGKEGSFYGIEDYLITKYLCLGGIH
ncbi:succinate semialdehyde dehydrogenase [Filimonas lacunae]|uniref:Aldehyde dehydrogenase n=1 Tax=Filimonas lacunae TaxID=477680 RepID=A0A173MQT8_9BACT|nr:NAD-dependent succinate-semialdehyde dehydrogenase [Filimonas lacunae]BAV10022.1 succinate-semialdehyde dehydrogenase [NAD(P)+] [Filimonas lacunae]SIS82693.1 succinate semialdehyde dehydrogenase [Filimonas lacunae]